MGKAARNKALKAQLDKDRVEKEAPHPFDDVERIQELVENYKDKWWRLNNLYYIVDDKGKRVLFQPNRVQAMLYDNIWFLNLILKSRQHGITTFVDIYFLDECLFNSNVEAGIIAHTREDVGKIFRRKILYPYNNLPDWIKETQPTKTLSKTEIEFANDSIISVGTSYRSGTAQLIHISEFGKICAKFPEKAKEIVTGTLEAIHPEKGDCIVFIESTAEGQAGYFFDWCQKAQNLMLIGAILTRLDYRFHFFAWFDDPSNVLNSQVLITHEMQEYFKKVEAETGRVLSMSQKWWYVKKMETLGSDMKREHPSTPKEAFEQAIEGSYYVKQFIFLRKHNRITRVPIAVGISVHTWWDLGMDDFMSIWFTQDVGREVHVIDYLEANGEGFEYYAEELREKKYLYGSHNGPHDITVREIGPGVSRWKSAKAVNLEFNKIPRPKAKIDAINQARRFYSVCWFDEERCSVGLARLENFRKAWDSVNGCWKKDPLHNDDAHGAAAFETLACGHPVFGAGRTVPAAVLAQQLDQGHGRPVY